MTPCKVRDVTYGDWLGQCWRAACGVTWAFSFMLIAFGYLTHTVPDLVKP